MKEEEEEPFPHSLTFFHVHVKKFSLFHLRPPSLRKTKKNGKEGGRKGEGGFKVSFEAGRGGASRGGVGFGGENGKLNFVGPTFFLLGRPSPPNGGKSLK